MITKFNTFEQFHGRKEIGGTELRAHWPIAKWNEAGPDIGEAGLYHFGDKPDVLIFQKVYNFELAENIDCIKILDLCDPDFLHPAYPIKRMINACDAVTCSSEKLAAAVASFSGDRPVWFIPDCVLEPEKMPVKVHQGKMKSVSWFGYPDNFLALETAIPVLLKHNLSLVVVSGGPFAPRSLDQALKLTNYPFNPATYIRDIMQADILINPKIATGRFSFKSDNKTVKGWACGMPVAHNEDELIKFWDEESRVKEGLEKRQWVIENRDVKKFVVMMKELILEIKKTK